MSARSGGGGRTTIRLRLKDDETHKVINAIPDGVSMGQLIPDNHVDELLRYHAARGTLRNIDKSEIRKPLVKLSSDGKFFWDGFGIGLLSYYIQPEPKKLSQLAGWDSGKTHPHEIYALALDKLKRAYSAGYNPVLYEAYRDLFPPRPVPSKPISNKDSNFSGGALNPSQRLWRIDAVNYHEGVLPGGELFRSTGHWNPIEQVEIFQVLDGKVFLIFGGRSVDGRNYAFGFALERDEIVVCPPGAWHITYVIAGHALVLNIYMQESFGASTDEPGESKYHALAPLEIAVGVGGRLSVGPGTSSEYQEIILANPSSKIYFQDLFADSLARMYLEGADSAFSRIEERIAELYQAGWPCM
ncbi:MAG: cupin domain-containing protein [Pyrinomonadaceae bacterium]